MSISIELLLLLLAAVGVTISVGALEAMSFEEKAELGDSLLSQIQTGTRQDEFIQDLINANEDFESQKKEAIVTNLDGTKTQVKPITLGLPDRTFQNLRKYAVGINKGIYKLEVDVLTDIRSYTDIVDFYLKNDFVDTSKIGDLKSAIQTIYNGITYKNYIFSLRIHTRLRQTSTYRTYYLLYGCSEKFELQKVSQIERLADIIRVETVNHDRYYNAERTLGGILGHSDSLSIKMNYIADYTNYHNFVTNKLPANKDDMYTGISYQYNIIKDIVTLIGGLNYGIKSKAVSKTTSEDYDIAGVGSIAKNPNRVLTIEDLEEAISKVGISDLVGTNTAEKVIPFDTTTDKTITGDIPISDAIEDLDNSLPVINPIPSLPEYVDGGSSTNSLFKMYHVTTSAQLPQLANILWDENLISQLQKWISNPMDYIVSLQAFPIGPIDGDMEEVKIGSFATNLSMKKVANQFMTYSCGSVRVDKKFFNFLDTITTIDIYLPFIGIFPLNTTQVIGGKLSVDYQIDFLSGSCVANIRLIKDNQNVIIATNSGNLSAVLPLSSRDFSNVYGALIGTVGGAIGTAVGFASGNVAMGTASALGTLNNVSGFRQGVRNSGAINGNSGLLNYKKPFLIINRPIPKIPNNYGHSVGFLDNTERYLNQVSGFSKFTNVDLSSVTLTELEKDRIKQKLEAGCIF